MIQFKNISKHYQLKGQTLRALDQINLEIPEGSIFGIIGYSGAGKSTLLKLLTGTTQPTKGSIEIQGRVAALLERVGDAKVDVVLSDMAPNMSGTPAVDQPRSIYLIELALDMCRQVLAPNGSFVVKVFQGVGSEEYLKAVREVFKVVKVRKPDSSRARSREVYIVATGFKL